ncbi:hypothetical protein N0V90_012466 [Kalmusia sp. IMI 367209]|nr:hypothetical protein N0V90_012466 [Kalmusia sp. IMI 367209]
MPPRAFINDALWRCLCPRYTSVPNASGSRLIDAGRRASSCKNIEKQQRKYHQSVKPSQPTPTAPTTVSPFESFEGYSHASRAHRPTPRPTPSFHNSREPVSFVHLSNKELYDRLRIDGAAGKHDDVMKAITILIKDRSERPNLQMYTAMLHSYTNPEVGTAGKLRKALADMGEAGVELDGRAAECVLEALAVHPDSFLRTDVLEYMKERWFNLSARGHNFVVAGLLRERCFEQALEKLEVMIRERIKIEEWLWDKTVWMLLEFGEVEEAFYVLSLKQNLSGDNLKFSASLWVQLLDVAGRKHIPEAVNMIWNNQIVPGYLKPTTGTCYNVLSVASRAGNVKLATDVFRVLAERDTVFTAHHYEELIACYLVANDLPAALSVVLIMQDSSLKVTEDELHPLYVYLSKEDSRPMDAFLHLQELEASGKKIPTALVNCCIRASIKRINLSEAIELYKALHTVSKAGPNTATFNDLFRGCHKEGRKELAMYLANEMIELGIKPDRVTYDRLILVCLKSGDVNDALLYYEEMRSEGFYPRRGTHEDLIEYALKEGDGRCVAVLNQYKQQEYAVPARVATLERAVYRKFEEGGQAKEKERDHEDSGSAADALTALQEEMGGEEARNAVQGSESRVGSDGAEKATEAPDDESQEDQGEKTDQGNRG